MLSPSPLLGDNERVSLQTDPTLRRRQPVQQRSRKTFDKLCAAALDILNDGGITALNTNAVAERAGVSITAVYSYFPDKFAILHELFLRVEMSRVERIVELLDSSAEDEDWRAVVREAITLAASSREQAPESLALRRAMSAIPALAELNKQGNAVLATRLAQELRSGNSRMRTADAERASAVLITAIGSSLDACIVEGKIDRKVLREVMTLAECYVEALLENDRIKR